MTHMTKQIAISRPHAGRGMGLPCLDFVVSPRQSERFDADYALRDNGLGMREGNTRHREFVEGDSP